MSHHSLGKWLHGTNLLAFLVSCSGVNWTHNYWRLLPVPTIELSSCHDDKPNTLFPNILSSGQGTGVKRVKWITLTESIWRGFSPVGKVQGVLWKSNSCFIRRQKNERGWRKSIKRQPRVLHLTDKEKQRRGSTLVPVILVVGYKLRGNCPDLSFLSPNNCETVGVKMCLPFSINSST